MWENDSLQRIFDAFKSNNFKHFIPKNDKLTPGVFKAFLYHAECKKITLNWAVAQTNGLSFLKKRKSELLTSIVTMETNTISCIGALLSQWK